MAKQFTRKFWRADGTEVALGPIFLDPDGLRIVGDLDEEAADVCSVMGLAAELLGDVETDLEDSIAQYRHWAGGIARTEIEQNPKCAEWKTRAAIESDAGFLQHKRAIAKLEGDKTFLKNFIDAARSKGFLVKAMMSQRGDDEVDSAIPLPAGTPRTPTVNYIKSPAGKAALKAAFAGKFPHHATDDPENGLGQEAE